MSWRQTLYQDDTGATCGSPCIDQAGEALYSKERIAVSLVAKTRIHIRVRASPISSEPSRHASRGRYARVDAVWESSTIDDTGR
jgi:hypothetical protein